MPIRHETLQSANAHGLALDTSDALGFALFFLRTYTAADGGEAGGFADDLISGFKVPLPDLLNEGGDVDVHGTARHTGGILAVETPSGLVKGL